MIRIENISLNELNGLSKGTLAETLNIEFVEITKSYLVAKMPVDHTTKQPFGVLHGGASMALSETVGSIGGICCLDKTKQYCVGLEINANHIRPVKSGYVFAKATPLHIGNKTQVWDIKISNEEGKLVCVSRLTLAVLDLV